MAQDLGGFGTLFNKSVPHILENIFFLLDYDSFMTCRRVCQAWDDLLTSDKYSERSKKLLEKKTNEKKLYRSSTLGNIKEVDRLLSSGVDPNCVLAQMKFAGSPLHQAIKYRHKEIVKLLLDAGADPPSNLGGFGTLFNKSVPHILENIFFSLDYDSFMTCHKVCLEWKELLTSEFYRERAESLLAEKRENEDKLRHFSSAGNTEEVYNLLSSGVDPNCALSLHQTRGYTPLYNAVMGGLTDVVKLLLDRGADPNRAKKDGKTITPLHRAVEHHNAEMIKLLLKAGADPNMGSSIDFTPLHRAACISIATDKVKLLLDAGANPNAMDKRGRTPLTWAIDNKRKDKVKLLLEWGANPSEKQRDEIRGMHLWTDKFEILKKSVPQNRTHR